VLTPAQCRAGRGLIDMQQTALADKAGVSPKLIIDFERGKRNPRMESLLRLREALEEAGVEFIPADEAGGPGVRLKK